MEELINKLLAPLPEALQAAETAGNDALADKIRKAIQAYESWNEETGGPWSTR